MTNWYDKVLDEVGEEAPTTSSTPVTYYPIVDEDVDSAPASSPASSPSSAPAPATSPIASNWYSDILQDVGEDDTKIDEVHEPSLRQVFQPEALLETGKHLGAGALSFFPSIASGLGELIRQKSLNTARSFVEGSHSTDEYAFKKRLEEAKTPEDRQSLIDNRRLIRDISVRRKLGDYKSSEEIRDLVNEASGIWSGLLDPPKTEGGKASLQLAEVIMHDMLFYYPRKADEWLSEKGFPNLGWLVGIAGELTSLKMMHSSAKAVKKIPKDYMRFLDDLDLKIPEDGGLLVISKPAITKAEGIVNKYLDDIGVPKDKTVSPEVLQEYIKKTYKKPPEDALKRPTKRQKISGHELARKAGLNEQQRRTLAEEITGERSMIDMNRQSAGEFIKSIKDIIKEKKVKAEMKAEIDIEIKQELKSVPEPKLETIIPLFKNTEQALSFGKRATPEQAVELKQLWKESVENAKGLTGQAKMDAGFRSQLYREAFEEAVKVQRPKSEAKLEVSEDVKIAIIDDMQVVKDMGVYAEIKELLGKQKDADSIMKILEKGEFFKEDLRDFKYTKADVRESINAVKADMGDKAVLKQREDTLRRESATVEKIEQDAEIREVEIPSDIERVDPIKGRPSGATADLTPSPKQKTDVELEFTRSRLPIRSDTGKILRSKIAARNRARELGREGEMIKNPEGEGWYVKRSKEQRKKTEEVEKKAWEDLLKEEEPGKEFFSQIKSKSLTDSMISALDNNRGSITLASGKKKLIKTVNNSRINILKDITGLHTDGKIDVDLTYSKGAMWKGTGIDPLYKIDKRVEKSGVIQADITKGTPLRESAVNSVVFDPPFLISSLKSEGIIGKRFTTFRSSNELWNFFKAGLKESYRILKPGGKLITKTQDVTTRSGILASSSEIYNFAIQQGFRPIDRFIYTPKAFMPLPPNIKVQKHARKVHSDFWVFEKPKRSYKHPKESGIFLDRLMNETGSITIREKHERYKSIAQSIRTDANAPSIKNSIASSIRSGIFTKEEGNRIIRAFEDHVNTSKGSPLVESITKKAKISDVVDYSKQEVGFIPSILKNETGSITIDLSAIKKIRETIKEKKISKEEMIKGLIYRGASPDDLLRVFPEISVREMNVVEQKPSVRKTNGVEQTNWLKPGQDPKELLPGRKIKGKRKAPAVSREDAQMIATTTDLKRPGSEGLKKAPIGEKVRLFATSEGVFTRIGKPLREAFYRRAITSHKKASDYAKDLLTDSRKIQKTFKLGSRELHSERIDIYSIAQQPDGVARLRLQGIKKIPKLTKKEKIAYNELQLIYKDLFVKINKAREAVGQKKFEAVENYSVWAHDMQKLKDIERISTFDKIEKIQAGLDRIRDIPSQIDKLGRTLSLKGHEKLRAGPDLPGYLILDAFENFNVYAKIAADTIHKSYDIAYMHELLGSKFKLSENAPNTYKFLSEWLDFQKGHEPILFIENPKARRLMKTLSSNVATAYLTYAIRPVIVQLASLNLSYAKLGERFMAEGIVRLLDPRELKRATKESSILTTRSPEEILMRAQRVYPFFSGLKGKAISKGVQKAKQTGFKGLFLTDSIVSYLTYLGAEAKGRSLYKKLSEDQKRAISKEEFSRDYADDVVVQCQGSAAASARAPIQRHAEGKFITTLGTFTIANFNFISQHLLGIKNPNITKPQTLASAMRFVIASTLISSIFEDSLNLTSPIPTPIRAFQEVIEKNKSIRKGVQASAKELLEFIPVYGGKYKFDSELLGPVSDQLVKLGKGDFSTLGRLFGLPGFQALWKAYRAEKAGGTAIDMIMGRYLEPFEKQESITKGSRKITGGKL